MSGRHYAIDGWCRQDLSCRAAREFRESARVHHLLRTPEECAALWDALAADLTLRRCGHCGRPIALRHFRVVTWCDADGPDVVHPVARRDLPAAPTTPTR